MASPFIYTLPLAVSELQQQSCAGVTKTTGPESLKLPPWPFKEKGVQTPGLKSRRSKIR